MCPGKEDACYSILNCKCHTSYVLCIYVSETSASSIQDSTPSGIANVWHSSTHTCISTQAHAQTRHRQTQTNTHTHTKDIDTHKQTHKYTLHNSQVPLRDRKQWLSDRASSLQKLDASMLQVGVVVRQIDAFNQEQEVSAWGFGLGSLCFAVARRTHATCCRWVWLLGQLMQWTTKNKRFRPRGPLLCNSQTHPCYVLQVGLFVSRVGQNHIYMRCIYGVISRELTKYTVIHSVYIRFWPTLLMRRTDATNTQKQVAALSGLLPCGESGKTPVHVRCLQHGKNSLRLFPAGSSSMVSLHRK